MLARPRVAFEPRKTPVQARSQASVEAILHATVQVLLSHGKDRLTTTRVATRAGVSVGTLYQYYPNKTALLLAALDRHLDQVAEAVERVCLEQAGNDLQSMATALVEVFLAAKVRDPKAGVALYAVSSDLDSARLVRLKSTRSHRAIVAMLQSSCEPLARDPQLVATMLQGVLTGVSRSLLQGPSPEKQLPGIRAELIFVARAYLQAGSARDHRAPAAG